MDVITFNEYYSEVNKEQKNKLVGPLIKKKLPTEVCPRRNGEQGESFGAEKSSLSDDRQH